MSRTFYLSISIALVLIVATASFFAYRVLYSDNVHLENGRVAYLHLSTQIDHQTLTDSLRSHDLLTTYWSFQLLARYMKLDEQLVPGRYAMHHGMTNLELIRMFRSGHQEPVDVLIRPVRTKDELVSQLARDLKGSDSVFLHALDTLIAEDSSLNRYNYFTRFIPNTYQMYWNASPERVYHRLFEEANKFWLQKNRLERAEALGLTPEEVYILASIVDRETNVKAEKPIIAGVYLNRIERQMPLQADPTIIYAIGDFSLKRVLHKHLEVESPYNTYQNPGLPPGPIGMASIEGIDSVLAAKDHNFLYFCAKADGNGEHAFATNLQGHLRNARRFQRWLNSRDIK